MDHAIIVSRVLVASVAVWRLSSLFFEGRGYGGRSHCFSPRPENILGNRTLDCVCWLSVWLSAQTAIWVAGGLAAVLVNWLLFSSLSRLFTPMDETPDTASYRPDSIPEETGTANEGCSSFSVVCAMQANHG